MKKIFVLIFVLLFLFTACDDNTGGKTGVTDDVYNSETEYDNINIPDSTETTEPLKGEGDVEKNINADELSEDKELTEEAEDKKVTESDVIVGEKEIEDEKDSLNQEEEIVLKTFKSQIPDEVVKNIKYDRYEVPTDYLLILSTQVNIREKPSVSSKVIGNAHYFEKVNLLAEVKGELIEKYESDLWYKIAWKSGDKVLNGYIFSKLAEPRGFQFNKMFESVNRAKNELENNTTAYISNYQNRVGTAPLYNGSTIDKFGARRYQSAPAYYEPRFEAEFRYISDGTMVSVLAETDSFYKVRTLNFDGEYYVQKKYVSFRQSVENLTKVIVVDRRNQNEGVFEFVDGKWNLISYIYATTGENARHKLPTDLGYYMAIQKVGRFSYLDDVTRQIAGYAPYAIRFNGGAYIHGVPVDYKKDEGRLIDPGMQEYLFTIGTVPRSHKCVRNYTSHAKFLHDWIEIGKSIVIVIE